MALLLFCLLGALPRTAFPLTWTRALELPQADVTSVQAHGDVVYATAEDRVHRGADHGSSWTVTNPVGASPSPLVTVVPAAGFLWVGSYGKGVYRSPDGGSTWASINTGFTGLGAPQITELVTRGDTLYAATDGAGVFLLDLNTPTEWKAFNQGIPVAIAGGVQALELHGTMLVAAAGGNGFVYRNQQGTNSWLEIAIQPPNLPGFVPTSLHSDGTHLLVASGTLVFHSADAALSWARADTGLSNGLVVHLASAGPVFFALVNLQGDFHQLFRAAAAGGAWQALDQVTAAYVYDLVVVGERLFAARTDGLWSVPLSETPVEPSTWGQMKSRFRR